MRLRSECYMTFSEALDAYMEANRLIEHFGKGQNRESAKGDLEIAKSHMDALTGPPEMRWLIYPGYGEGAGEITLQYKDGDGNWDKVPEITWEKARNEGSL